MSPHLLIERAGPAVSVQDGGRPGYAHDGISPSGAMDPDALVLANALCGNAANEAAIEFGLSGLSFKIEANSLRLALAGAPFALTIDGQKASSGRSYRLCRGQRVAIGAASDGVWGYLAIAGGLALPPVLGSRATHWRSGLGGLHGRLLQAGDRLPLAAETAPAGKERVLPPLVSSSPAASVPAGQPIRVMLGPQADAFEAEGIATFLSAEWRIGQAVDRMAYRLEGPAIAHKDGFNIVSDGIVRGSVQIPGHGRPLVMMADHQTTGGYPKIATVISADHARLAQLPPGATCRFAAVDLEAALAARLEADRSLAAALRRTTEILGNLPQSLDSSRLLGLNLISGVVGNDDDDGFG